MSDPDMSIRAASEIKAILGRQDVSKAELARRLNVSHTWVTNRLAGHLEIGLTELQRIADALGVSYGDLLPAIARERTMTPSVLQPRRSRQIGVRTIVPSADRRLTGRVPGPNGQVAALPVDQVATISRRTGRLSVTP